MTGIAIETDSLTKRFGDVTAIERIDLSVGEGEVFGLLGPNGAGKSTTIDLLLGLTTPTEGAVEIFGIDVADRPRAVRARLGVLPENYDVYDDLTGREHVEAICRLKETDDDPGALLERVGLSPEAFDREAGEYSKGMRQRLVLATALAGDPDLLVLDEPTSGLDPGGIALVRELVGDVAARGTTVFFSSHRLAEVEAVCDRVGIVDDGELVAVEDVDALAERTAGTERLRLFTEDAIRADLVADLESLETVAEVTCDERTLTVDCTTPATKADVVERVNRASDVRDFELEGAVLEDVFSETVAEDRTADDGAAAADSAAGTASDRPPGVSE